MRHLIESQHVIQDHMKRKKTKNTWVAVQSVCVHVRGKATILNSKKKKKTQA